MMGTEMIPEASVILKQLTRITALEDFIKFINTYWFSLNTENYNFCYLYLISNTVKLDVAHDNVHTCTMRGNTQHSHQNHRMKFILTELSTFRSVEPFSPSLLCNCETPLRAFSVLPILTTASFALSIALPRRIMTLLFFSSLQNCSAS
jgi:hypothetical protein